jgi:hypothetical protein
MDLQHRCQRIRRAATPLTALGVMGLIQIDQCLPTHDMVHISQELHSLGALLGRGLIVDSETELLASHQPVHGKLQWEHYPMFRIGLPESA